MYPRKRQTSNSRVPIYTRPFFDEDTEKALLEATLQHCAKKLNVARISATHHTSRRHNPSDKLVLKIRLQELAKKPKSRDPKHVRDRQSEVTAQPDEDDPATLYIPKRKRSSSKSLNNPSAAPGKSRKAVHERPATKILHPRPAESVAVTNNVVDVDNPPSPKTPLEHILQFARGNNTSMTKIGKADKKQALKMRTNLATFRGCEELSHISLTAYLRTLASVHHVSIRSAVRDGEDKSLVQNGLDTLERDMTDDEFTESMFKDGRRSRRREQKVAPYISKTVDIVQLIWRLWQRMSCAEESLAQAFTSRLYVCGVVQSVSSLAYEILSLWHTNAKVAEPGSLKRSELVESCVRILSNVLVYELSPVSGIWGNVKSGFVFKAKTANGEPWLPKLLESILYLVDREEMTTSRDCRLAAGELYQLYVVRCHCPFPGGSEQKQTWDEGLHMRAEQLSTLISSDTFWSTAVGSAMQTIRKQEDTPDADFAITFLHSLLSEGAAAKSLVQKQTTHRDVLLGVLAKLLERLDRQLLSAFVQIERSNRSTPVLPSSVDLIRKLMSSAVLQRELISSRERERKRTYLDAIASILSRLAKLVPGEIESDKLMVYAREGAFSGTSEKLLTELPADLAISRFMPEVSDSDADDPNTLKDCQAARMKALAFGAWLVGALGKSMEDGSRDMTQMNGLQILLSSRFNSTRALKKLWRILFKIQAGLEHDLRDTLVDSPAKRTALLTEDERGHFCMAVEAVRLKVISEPKDRITRHTPDSTPKQTPKQSSSEGETENDSKQSNESGAFPDVTQIKDLRRAVASHLGCAHFDQDLQMLGLLEKTYKSRGEQTLARYDSSSEYVSHYHRLPKKNSYLEDAREFLDKAEKTVGQKCGCIPGNPVRGSTDSQMRIACTNNLCENRSTHVECAPDKCGAGAYCQNQRMQRMQYAKMKKVPFPGKGMGIVADEDIAAGSFIGEYQGEIISMKMFEKRKREYQGERHFYFMTLTSKLVIDASRKSQITRFVNHSCEPNAETQKWNAGGEPRVGIFALKDIRKSDEITFDYGARSLANDTVPCLCGAKSCRGFLTIRKKLDSAKEGECEAIFDTSAFVNAANDMKALGVGDKVDGVSSKTAEEGTPTSHSRKLQESVHEKIKRGKKDLEIATEFAKLWKEMNEALKPFDEPNLEGPHKKKLSDWVLRVKNASKKRRDKREQTNAASKPEARVRIPRRSEPPRKESFLESYLRKESEAKKSSKAGAATRRDFSKPFPRKPPTHNSSSAHKFYSPSRQDATARQPRRSYEPQRDRRPASLAERKDPDDMMVDIYGSHSAKRTPSAEYKAFDRPGPMPAFLPTAPKVKKPLLKPKVAKKEKPKRDDSDVDSMDDYSIASSAEPVIEDDPPLSPSNLPDGLGACSDDEFVEAPPLDGPPPRHPEDERADPRTRGFAGEHGRDHARGFNLGGDRHRLPDPGVDVRGMRHGEHPDRFRRWPEERIVRSNHNPLERNVRGDRSVGGHRMDSRRPEDYGRRRSGPEYDRLPHNDHLAGAHSQAQVRDMGPPQNPRLVAEARGPRGSREDRFRPQGHRPPRETVPSRSADRPWINSAPRGYDRGRPLPGSEPEINPRSKENYVHGPRGHSEMRELNHLEHGDGRGPMSEKHPPRGGHGMPPPRRDGWGRQGSHGFPPRAGVVHPAELGSRDGDHRDGRASRWRDDRHSNTALLRETGRKGDMWAPDPDQGPISRRVERRSLGSAVGALPSLRSELGAKESPRRDSRAGGAATRHSMSSPRQRPRGEPMTGSEARGQSPPRHPRDGKERDEAMRRASVPGPKRQSREELTRAETSVGPVSHHQKEGVAMKEMGHAEAAHSRMKPSQDANRSDVKSISHEKKPDSHVGKRLTTSKMGESVEAPQKDVKVVPGGDDKGKSEVKANETAVHGSKTESSKASVKSTGETGRIVSREAKNEEKRTVTKGRSRFSAQNKETELRGSGRLGESATAIAKASEGKDGQRDGGREAVQDAGVTSKQQQKGNGLQVISTSRSGADVNSQGKMDVKANGGGRSGQAEKFTSIKSVQHDGGRPHAHVALAGRMERNKSSGRFGFQGSGRMQNATHEKWKRNDVPKGRNDEARRAVGSGGGPSAPTKGVGPSKPRKAGNESGMEKVDGLGWRTQKDSGSTEKGGSLKADKRPGHDEERNSRGFPGPGLDAQRRGMARSSSGWRKERDGKSSHEDVRESEGPGSREGAGGLEKEKSVMKRIGRRLDGAADGGSEAPRGPDIARRIGGKIVSRHGEEGYEKRRRPDDWHEHGRKRFRRDDATSPRRDAAQRRRSMESSRARPAKRGHSERWEPEHRHAPRGGDKLKAKPLFVKEGDARAPKPKKTDLRRLIRKR